MFAKFSVKKPLTVFVSVFMIVILGFVSFSRMTPDLLPSINLPYAMVMTVYAGATPEEVEAEITQPMESTMATLEDIENISSTSSENLSMVILEFSEDANMDAIVSDIREKINGISDPWSDMVSTPYIMEINPDLMPVTVSAVTYEGLDSIELTNFMNDKLLNELEGTSGVASIDVMGGVTEKVDVILSQEKIDELNQKLTDSVLAEFADAEEEMKDGEEAINDGLNEIEGQESDLEGALNSLKDGQDALVDETASAQSDLLDKKLQLISSKAEMEEQLAAAKDGLKQLEEGLPSLEEIWTQYNELKTNLSQINEAISSLEGMKTAYPEIVNGMTAIEAQIAMLDPETQGELIAQLNAQLTELQTNLMVMDTALAAMGATYETIDQTIATYNENKTKIEAGMTAIETSLAENDMDINTLDETIADMKDQISEVQDGISTLEELLAGIESGDKTLSEALEQINQAQISGSLEISQGYTQIVTGQSALASAKASLESAKEELDAAKEEFDETKETTLESTKIDITMDMINMLLTAQNFSMPAGYITEDNVQYLIRVGEKVEDLESLKALPLMNIDAEGLGLITLEDVADVFITDDSSSIYAKLNHEDSIILSFSKQSTYATATVSENVADKISDLEDEYPGLSFVSLTDQGDYIDLIVNNVLQNLVLGAILAIIILLLFLKDIRPTIIIACSIPISLLFAIVLMYFSGITLNIISLSGLAVGVGMLVDNSVVVIENIYRMHAEGEDRFRAAVKGTTQVAGAIVSSTLTTVCVFLPIVFIDGITRDLFTDMALTIAYSLGASLIIALTLVPAMSSGMLKRKETKNDLFFSKLLDCYEKIARFSLKRKWIALGLSVVLLFSSAIISISQGFIFMPSMSGTQLTITVTPNNDEATFEENVELTDTVCAIVSGIDEIETVGAMISNGEGTNMMSMAASGTSIYAIMSDDAKRKDAEVCKDIEALCADLDAEVTAAGSMDMTSMMSSMSGSGVTVQIFGNDLNNLMQEAENLSATLEGIEGITEVSTGLEDNKPEISIIVDKAKAMENSLTVAEIFQNISGAITTETESIAVSLDGDTESIFIYKTDESKMSVDDLKNYVLEYTDNFGEDHVVNLKDVAKIEETESLNSISRDNQRRTLTVSAGIDDDHNITLVTKEVMDTLKDYQTLDGNTIEVGGESESIMEAITQLGLMLLLAVVMIYFIMVAQFQSFKSPFIVMFTIPLAFTGGFLALLITGREVSVISMIGFVMLAGIIVNNGIVLIDYINILRLEGMEKQEAIILAGKTRMRPILMTALTTILGLVFMALGTGTGTELMQPIAIVCIGGLAYATLMTLFVVPAMYDILSKKEMHKIDVD